MFSNLCSRAWICCSLLSLPVCLGVSDAVRCTVRARKWPFIMTSSDFTVLSTSFLCERNKRRHVTVSEREIFEQTCLEWDSVSYQDYWYTWISCRVRHRLTFILIEWWLWICTLMLQSSSSIGTQGLCLSNILDQVCPCLLMMKKTTIKKKKERERGRETIFDVMHDVMWS